MSDHIKMTVSFMDHRMWTDRAQRRERGVKWRSEKRRKEMVIEQGKEKEKNKKIKKKQENKGGKFCGRNNRDGD